MGLGTVSAAKGCSLAHDITSWHVLGLLRTKPEPNSSKTVGRAPLCVPRARLYHILIGLVYYSSITISLGCGTPGNKPLSEHTSSPCVQQRSRDAAARHKTAL